MLRYELHSNAAAGEQGLHRFPAVDDLVQTLAARGVETRLVRQVYREEASLNLASGKHARGVNVRGRSVRESGPETHLRGCLAWLRAVLAQPERGLHLELTQLRATNGAALVMGQTLARKRRVFVSGVSKADWPRLTSPADPACATVPSGIAKSETLLRDYLGRASRPTGFMSALQRLAGLTLLPAETQSAVQELVAARDPSGLRRLSQAQIVNIALLDELVERYERLVAQYCVLLSSESTQGDLPSLFELLTQGLAFDRLRRSLLAYVLEDRRVEARDKRLLVNELRIALRQAQEHEREAFQRALLSLVIRHRAAQDPLVYARVQPLDEVDADRLEALAPGRQQFLAWVRDGEAPAGAAAQADQPAPPEVKLGLFELTVNLIYQAKLTKARREGPESPMVHVARELLGCVVVRAFDVRRLHTLTPGSPARGVARNLAERIPVTVGELQRIQVALWTALFPLGRVALALAQELAARHGERAAAAEARAKQAFLIGAHKLLDAMNYVVGHAGGDAVLRQGVLAAGRALGLNVLASRDQIRRPDLAPVDAGQDELQPEGYQLLMVRDQDAWFPIRATPGQLSGAYLQLIRDRAASAVRQFLNRKIAFLQKRHGTRLFALMRDHLVRRVGLSLSQAQLATLLQQARLFDAARLREFGFREGEADADSGADPRLATALAGDERRLRETWLGSRSEAACRTALREFRAALEAYGGIAGELPEAPDLAQALAALAAEETFDLQHPDTRAPLARTREAAALTAALTVLLRPFGERLTGHTMDAVLEVSLPEALAPLALLCERHTVELEGEPVPVRLLPELAAATHECDAVRAEVARAVSAGLPGALDAPLKAAVQRIAAHEQAWRKLTLAATVPLLDQMLRETVLRIVQPSAPLPAALRELPEGAVFCVGASARDQARFAKLVRHPENRDAFATLSELASWLARFGRLREELGYFREIIADVREILADLNLSIYDAIHVTRYGREIAALDAALAVRPEEITASDLEAVQRQAQLLGGIVRSAFELERGGPFRYRWMGRIAVRLRGMRPNVRLTFVDALHEQRMGSTAPDDGEPTDELASARRREDHQTFGERVRNVVAFRTRLDAKRAFVLAPQNTQRRLALAVIDQLYRLKGVHTPVLVDISGCEDLVPYLQTLIPPHRLFSLNTL